MLAFLYKESGRTIGTKKFVVIRPSVVPYRFKVFPGSRRSLSSSAEPRGPFSCLSRIVRLPPAFVDMLEMVWGQRMQRHNDSRGGISPPSEPDVKVSPHPAFPNRRTKEVLMYEKITTDRKGKEQEAATVHIIYEQLPYARVHALASVLALLPLVCVYKGL
ncbi:hypothetical protein Acr_18g0011170 [Actinidia rufa]|uniref:Uncharacterized protein n=1 Tax=Actinidia rufa TaxID=165716 RepID=A0A7J0G822_9ERIC|nr:hypothetical protein Acr_18g0011170 [Actinidia rufa]